MNQDDSSRRAPALGALDQFLPQEPERFVEALAALVFGDRAAGIPPSPALCNRFLTAFAQGEFTRAQLIAYAIQHYQLVDNFTRYMEFACSALRHARQMTGG